MPIDFNARNGLEPVTMWNVQKSHVYIYVLIFLQLSITHFLTMAGSWSTRSHSLRFFSGTLISDAACDQTPLHPLSTGNGALRKSANTDSLTCLQQNRVLGRQSWNEQRQVTQTVNVRMTRWNIKTASKTSGSLLCCCSGLHSFHFLQQIYFTSLTGLTWQDMFCELGWRASVSFYFCPVLQMGFCKFRNRNHLNLLTATVAICCPYTSQSWTILTLHDTVSRLDREARLATNCVTVLFCICVGAVLSFAFEDRAAVTVKTVHLWH